ncbi:MAG: dehypoxanthine futalosine cyclase [Deferribacterales bacterium]|jgi:cyclic dehypoxanthinyl futalosine synthase|nr:dehypoxanthine futalosine cyclase [Deferribacterales bacterium]
MNQSKYKISRKEAIELFESSDLLTIGKIADDVRRKNHSDNKVTFVIDRNINYTNICYCQCRFCGFYKRENEDGAYVITDEDLFKKIDETIQLNGTQILLQGGLNKNLKIDYYENLLKKIKDRYDIWIHGFSPPEICHIADVSNMSVEDVLKRLIDSGLDSIPGGGAELLVDSERTRVSPNKINSHKWLDVMKKAHRLGLKTTATMMFKKNDPIEFILEHLQKIRDLQDETGGFTAFIPWPFQPLNTELGGDFVTATEYLKILALSRIFLYNIKNIQVSWVTQGPKIGQIGLFFGGNDFGSLMIEENVVAACGATYSITVEEIVNNIEKAGFKAAQRDMQYNILREF